MRTSARTHGTPIPLPRAIASRSGLGADPCSQTLLGQIAQAKCHQLVQYTPDGPARASTLGDAATLRQPLMFQPAPRAPLVRRVRPCGRVS